MTEPSVLPDYVKRRYIDALKMLVEAVIKPGNMVNWESVKWAAKDGAGEPDHRKRGNLMIADMQSLHKASLREEKADSVVSLLTDAEIGAQRTKPRNGANIQLFIDFAQSDFERKLQALMKNNKQAIMDSTTTSVATAWYDPVEKIAGQIPLGADGKPLDERYAAELLTRYIGRIQVLATEMGVDGLISKTVKL